MTIFLGGWSRAGPVSPSNSVADISVHCSDTRIDNAPAGKRGKTEKVKRG